MGFLGKTFKKAFGKRVGGFLANPLRRLQRSHKLGKLGHSLLPSMSDQNYLTHAFNKLSKSIGRSALRAAERQSASLTGNSAYTASHASLSPNQALDYSYRRLKDIM